MYKTLTAVAFALAAMMTTASAQAVDTKTEVQKYADNWRDAYNKKDAAAVAKMYAADAFMSVPNWTAAGQAAIEMNLKAEIASNFFNKMTSITVEQSYRVGDMNYAVGSWTAEMNQPDGKVVPVGGHWQTVARFDGDHALMLLHNSNVAMPPPK
jgi:ketosteroid isomerase-like protein